MRFRLSPVRSPLLGASLLFSLPQGTQMFQFPWLSLATVCVRVAVTRHDPCQVFPFGDPRICACLAAPRGLSQPATSFIGFQRLDIHRVPFATCRDDARARYGVLKGRGADRLRRLPGRPLLPGWGAAAAVRFTAGPDRPVAGRDLEGCAVRILQSCTVCPKPKGSPSPDPVMTAVRSPRMGASHGLE